MAHPKRRHSRSRRGKRRANWKLSRPNFARCPQCKGLRLPHRICPHCGYYNGKPVVMVEEEKKEKKR